MLTRADGQEVDEGDLHGSNDADSIPGRVCNVEPAAVSSREAEHNAVHRDEVGDEGIATPRGCHPVVEDGTQASPQHGALLDGTNPQEVGKDQQENGNGFVVVAASHGS